MTYPTNRIAISIPIRNSTNPDPNLTSFIMSLAQVENGYSLGGQYTFQWTEVYFRCITGKGVKTHDTAK